MSYTNWDPAQDNYGLSLFQGPNPVNNTIPGEILELVPTGSRVDLLDRVPPPAAETNWGNSIIIPPASAPLTPYTVSQSFSVARAGWYEIIVPYINGVLVGGAGCEGYDIVMYVGEVITPSTFYIAADSRAVVATDKCQTQLSCKFYASNPAYSYTMTIQVTALNLADPVTPIVGGTLTWSNIYIQPIVSSIDSVGNSPYVILP